MRISSSWFSESLEESDSFLWLSEFSKELADSGLVRLERTEPRLEVVLALFFECTCLNYCRSSLILSS